MQEGSTCWAPCCALLLPCCASACASQRPPSCPGLPSGQPSSTQRSQAAPPGTAATWRLPMGAQGRPAEPHRAGRGPCCRPTCSCSSPACCRLRCGARPERWGLLSCACCRTRALKPRRAGPLGAAAGVRAVCRRRHLLRPAAAHTAARAARARAAAAGRAPGGEQARLCAGRVRPPGEARIQARPEGAGLGRGPGRAAVRLSPRCPSLGWTAAAPAQTRARGRGAPGTADPVAAPAGFRCAWRSGRRSQRRTWPGCRRHLLAPACWRAAPASTSRAPRPRWAPSACSCAR